MCSSSCMFVSVIMSGYARYVQINIMCMINLCVCLFVLNQYSHYLYNCALPYTVESPFNPVIILVISATLSPPSFIPTARNPLPPFIQCGQELIIKTFWSQGEISPFQETLNFPPYNDRRVSLPNLFVQLNDTKIKSWKYLIKLALGKIELES